MRRRRGSIRPTVRAPARRLLYRGGTPPRPLVLERLHHPRRDQARTIFYFEKQPGRRAAVLHHFRDRDFKSSKVANERSKMHEKADLREANLNGAILADAKLGGAPRRGILLRHLHRAVNDIVTTSDVTP